MVRNQNGQGMGPRVVVVADDMTGALDTGIQFHKQGASVSVVSPGASDFRAIEAQVVVTNTESRHLEPTKAYARVRKAVTWARDGGVSYVYIKTDSALRGNIGPSLRAALDVVRSPCIAFAPAYPNMQRTLVDGKLLVAGVPVRKSVFGVDPHSPVKIDSVLELLQPHFDNIQLIGRGEGYELPCGEHSVLVFDTTSNEDLKCISQRLFVRGNLQLLAGCAAFAYWLYPYLGLPKCCKAMPEVSAPLLVVCGSINPISENQIRYGEAQGNHREILMPDVVASESYWQGIKGSAWFSRMRATMARKETITIDTGFARDDAQGDDNACERETIAARLGWILKELIDMEESSGYTAMVIGGDTLMGFLEALEETSLRLEGEVREGVVVSTILSRGKRFRLLSKSGGFGAQTLLLDLCRA